MPAAISPMVPPERRASAFGPLTALYGLTWFLGSALIGALYDLALWAAVAFCVITQLAALPLFLWVSRRASGQHQAP